ncbi:hypothetical protein BDY24DRAFT_415898 [Mrakia frigida]|uniref:GIY-YIG nuclease family protein n=1 Tax=Mrakia frigida TaxID=29902 RepID=UPI003FCBF056
MTSSYSGPSTFSPNPIVVPSSSPSERSILSNGSSYETCPSDSPPPPSSQPYPSSSSSYYYEQRPSPLPRSPYYNFDGGGRVEALEGALQGMNLVDPRAPTTTLNNKPLPRLPPPSNPPNYQYTHSYSNSVPPPTGNPREDPSSPRYRAGSSFTTVYGNLPRTTTTTTKTTPSGGGGGAAGLVLRRRDNGGRGREEEDAAGSSWKGDGGGRVEQGSQGRNDQAQQRPPSSSSSNQLFSPTISSDRSKALRLMPNSQYPPSYQHQPPHASSSTSPFCPPPPPPNQQHVPFPSSSSSSYAPPPPPPPPLFQHQPYTSPPSLPSQLNRFPSPRQPSFSALPPRSPTPSTPTATPPRIRAHSAVPLSSPSSSLDDRIQCEGKTKTGSRCQKRRGKDRDASSPRKQQAFLAALAHEGEGEEAWYCHLHKDAILRNTGVYIGGGGGGGGGARVWVEFEDWIPRELKDETRISLMTLMEKLPSSSSSESGFIYCFEYRGLSTPTYRVFKIGSSKNVASRIEQWGAQCPSKEPRLLGVCPEMNEREGSSRLKGLRGAGGGGGEGGRGVKGSLWFEKLVHLEIASLDPGIRQRDECVDCKRFHKEMFRIPRSPHGKEFEDLVWPVMERWERFVRMVLD